MFPGPGRGGPVSPPPPPPQVHKVVFQTTPNASGNDGFGGIISAMKAADKAATDASAKRAAEVARLTKLYGSFGAEVEKAEKRNRALAADMGSGAFSRRYQDMEKLNRQYAEMQRRAEAVAKYGERWGSVISKYGRFGAAAGYAAGGAAAAGVGTVSALAARGFQNTVELNRFNVEMTMLSRELAGVFKPFLTVATKFARVARTGVEQLDSGGQNRLMWGTVGTGAALWAARSAYTGGMVGRAFRVGGGPMGPGAMSRLSTASAGSTAAGAGGPGWFTRFARFGIAAAPFAAIGHSVLEAEGRGGRWSDYKAAGLQNLYTGGLNTIGMDPLRWAYRQFGAEGSLDATRGRINRFFGASGYERPGESAPAESAPVRRSVTTAGGGWEEVGSGFERINTSIGELTGRPDDSEEALGPLLKKLYDVLDRIEKLLQDKPELRPGG